MLALDGMIKKVPIIANKTGAQNQRLECGSDDFLIKSFMALFLLTNIILRTKLLQLIFG